MRSPLSLSTYTQSFLYHRHRHLALFAHHGRYYRAVALNKLDSPLERDLIVTGDKISIYLNVPVYI